MKQGIVKIRKMKANDICECGHERMNHNNRIIKPYFYRMKYNCCLDIDCPCTKFKIRSGD